MKPHLAFPRGLFLPLALAGSGLLEAIGISSLIGMRLALLALPLFNFMFGIIVNQSED